MYRARIIGTDIVVLADTIDDAYYIIGLLNDCNGRIAMEYDATI